MDVAAEKATELPKLGKPKMKLRVQASHTVRIGDLRFMSTLWKNLCPGIPPSRAKAYIMRLLDVMEKVPQKNMAPMTIVFMRGHIRQSGRIHIERLRATYHEDAGTLFAHRVQENLCNRLTS